MILSIETKNEGEGALKETTITINTADKVINGNSGIIVETLTESQKVGAIDAQAAALSECNDNMDRKVPATISPTEADKKRLACNDEDGASTTLTVYGFSGVDAESAWVIPIYEARVTKKRDVKACTSRKELSYLMKKLDYLTFTYDPLFQRVNITIGQSDIIFLNIKEVTEDESKPGPGREEDTMNWACNEYFLDSCCEFLFGPYCSAAVVRYFEENYYIVATERDAYAVFVAHFNRRLDLHSFENSTAERKD